MWFWIVLCWAGAAFFAVTTRWIGRIIGTAAMIGGQMIAVAAEGGRYPNVPGLRGAVETELTSTFLWVAAVSLLIGLGLGAIKDVGTKEVIADEERKASNLGQRDVLRLVEVALAPVAAPWVVRRWSEMSAEAKLDWLDQRRAALNKLIADLGGIEEVANWHQDELVRRLAELDYQ